VESYSAEWIWEQRIDDVVYVMELIVFAHDIVPGVSMLSLLLGLIQSSTSLLPVLVVTEVISETSSTAGFDSGHSCAYSAGYSPDSPPRSTRLLTSLSRNSRR
jgi:hypothetical protein